MSSSLAREEVTDFDVPDNVGQQLWNSNSWWLASGACLGFTLGWILRGKNGGVRIFDRIGKIAKFAVAHGTIPQTKLVLVVRSDLEMSRGKLAAQCAHAAVGSVENFSSDRSVLDLWLSTGQTKVVVRARDAQHLNEINASARASGLNAFLVQDAGRTEVAPGTVTVLAVGPAEVTKVDAITRSLKLF